MPLGSAETETETEIGEPQMSYIEPGDELNLRCPDCGYEIKKTAGGLKEDFNCPGCGLRFKTDKLPTVGEINEQIDDAITDRLWTNREP
jgi:tRNA(Ile2) C34 agmatinyltransferase TiaS